MTKYSQYEPRANFKPSTLIDLLRRRSDEQPDMHGYVFLVDGESVEASLTYQQLDRRARSIAVKLRETEAPNARALLLYPPGLDFIAAFFGCLYAGVIAVPAYPPDPARLNRSLPRLQSIIADAGATAVVTTSGIEGMVFDKAADLKDLNWISTDSVGETLADDWMAPPTTAGHIAFLQYTSGSTRDPRGVMVTHANLLHNLAVLQNAFALTPEDRSVSWLPNFHDMGLIAGVLEPLYAGMQVISMSPLSFLQRPLRWPLAICRYRATFSGGPNFAYELCARKINATEKAGLDLTSWSIAFNGSEPVRAETIERFTSAFRGSGLDLRACYPCYGLAEATLMVTGGGRGTGPVIRSVQKSALEGNRIVAAVDGAEDARRLVGCGSLCLPDQLMLTVDPASLTRSQPDQIGEIWLSGPSIAIGYWGRETETQETFNAYLSDTGEGPFLRTGDMGFLLGEDLYIAGRLKDLIIIRGRNHYPQDIELSVERCHPALRQGCGAAFSINVSDEERLVIVQEADGGEEVDFDLVIESIRETASSEHDLRVYAVALIKPKTIPKTSSGKIQRRLCRSLFLESKLDLASYWQATTAQEEEAEASNLAAENMEGIGSWLTAQLAAKLGVSAESIDSNQSIVRYGLDSLMAIELMHGIETRLGVRLPTAVFLQDSSIASLSFEVVKQMEATPASRSGYTEAKSEIVEAEYPLSHGQQGLWFLYQMDPGSTGYNIPAAFTIKSHLDIEVFQRALQSLVDRHCCLRTIFLATEGDPVQQVSQRRDVRAVVRDASSWGDADIKHHLAGEARRPFDLGLDPMIRATIFRRSPNENVLLLTVHHIVADFWSMGELIRDLGALYHAEETGIPDELGKLDGEYSGFVRWQADMLSGPEGETLWAYWSNQLSGDLPYLALPSDKTVPLARIGHSTSHHFRFSADLTAGLNALCRNHGVTLYTAMVAAFQALLHRYTGLERIVIGSAAAGRSKPQWRKTVGYFTNSIVLKADIAEGSSFFESLYRARDMVLGAMQNQDYPFPVLVERMRPARDGSRPPIFNIMFLLQKSHLADEALSLLALRQEGVKISVSGLDLESVRIEQAIAQYDLVLAVAEVEGRITCALEYNRDLYDAATIERMGEHFEVLLGSVLAGPRGRISDLEIMKWEDRNQIIREWNDTYQEYDNEMCIQELFERQSERNPEAIAVVYQEEQVSYGELERRANQVAQRLRSLGVGPEVRVGICVGRSEAMIVGILGILKAGGAYVPLDPGYPRERLEYMLQDSGAVVLVTDKEGAEGIAESGMKVLDLDSNAGEMELESDDRPKSGVGSGNLAYVIYTSGSTGLPKGVQIPHRCIANLLVSMQVQSGVGSRDILLSVTTLSFDMAVPELFLPISFGGCVVVATRDETRDGGELADRLTRSRPTWMQATPATWKLLIEGGWEVGKEVKVISGGEALTRELADRLIERSLLVWNMYGPTETCVYSTAGEVAAREEGVRIGRAIGNTEAYVMAPGHQCAAIGVWGELEIGGEGVGRGYLDRPDLTAEKFLPSEYSKQEGGRVYRTGDRVRYRKDGDIEYLGRLDDQVKIKGHRIEVGEVEAVIGQHGGIREAVVVAREETEGDKRLIAYVILEQGADADETELRHYLKSKLPDHMIPSWIVMVEAVPLTPNGKIDRSALRDRVVAKGAREGFAAPRNPLEQLLTGIWAEVLGLERVGIHDNYFDIGGHSLLATRVISRLRSVLQLEIQVRQLFDTPTIAGLASSIEEIGRVEKKDVRRIAEIWASIEQLSIGEADRLLAGENWRL
jgi:amino acid adenylation domain-containing protein